MRPSRNFLCCLMLLLLMGGETHAQDKIVPPSKRSIEDLQALPDDTMKVLYFFRVGWDTAYSNLSLGMDYLQEGLIVAKRINYLRGKAMCCNGIGATYNDMGEYDKALDAHIEGLGYCQQLGDPRRTGVCYMNTSLVYSSMGDTTNARINLEKAVRIFEEANYETGLSVVYINLGSMYMRNHQIEEGKAVFLKSQRLASKMEMSSIEAHSWSSLAVAYARLDNFDSAAYCIQHALGMIDTLNDDYTKAQIVSNLAGINATQKDYVNAEKNYRTSLAIFREVGVREEVVSIYEELSDLFAEQNNYDSALVYYKKFMLLRDSIVNEDVLKNQRNREARYDSEQTQQKIDLETRKGNVRHWLIVALIGCFVILTFLVVMLFMRNRFSRKTNRETSAQNAVIAEKNRNITDSINYASRIQEAVVPSVELLTDNFTDAFILSRPKDIVSGDFWWCTERDGEFFLAGADSTGHGVPGGFMSMLGSVFLFELVTEQRQRSPDEILNQLRAKVISALNRSGHNQGLKDGMDMVMCTFSPDRRKVQFSCAMNPLWVIRKNALIEYRADKFPVGEYHGETRGFTLQEHTTEPGDMLYIFSDGYADQFGGPGGKKFKYRQLRDILCSVADLSCSEQKKILSQRFDEWKGPHEQVDDVLIIGIRI